MAVALTANNVTDGFTLGLVDCLVSLNKIIKDALVRIHQALGGNDQGSLLDMLGVGAG